MNKTALILTVAVYLAASNVVYAAKSEFAGLVNEQRSEFASLVQSQKAETKAQVKKQEQTKQQDQTDESSTKNQAQAKKETQKQVQPKTKSSDSEDGNVAKKVMEQVKNKVQEMKQKAAKLKKNMVQKIYFYEQEVIDNVDEDGRAEFEAWGQMIYNHKKSMIVLNLHGLTPGAVYELQYGEEFVAEGTANDEGNVHIKETFGVEAFDETLFKVVAVEGDDVLEEGSLVAHTAKIKPLSEMDSDEYNEEGEEE
jgi:flagellar biosynthesis GTPase FlhF